MNQNTKINKDSTIFEAKEFLKRKLDEGAICPCCKQNVKMYRYKLTSGLAVVLVKFYHRSGKWVHPIKAFKTINGDYAKLRHWGLIEKNPKENENPNVKSHGLWRITDKGISFVLNSSHVCEKVKLYNGQAWGFDGKLINIKQALGNKFDYTELVNDNGSTN